jgi:hypothetical protein
LAETRTPRYLLAACFVSSSGVKIRMLLGRRGQAQKLAVELRDQLSYL